MAGPAPGAAQSGPAATASFSQGQHDSRGFGTEAARVDSQITLRIPDGRAQEVYTYLRQTYAESDAFLRSAFPDLPLHGDPKVDVSAFTDRYFDTVDLALYGTSNTIRHRNRINTTNPADRKSGRHLVQIKYTPPGQFDRRTELKFEVKPSRRYRGTDDLSPLLRLVERSQRPDLKSAIEELGVEPLQLRPALTIRQTRSRVYLYWGRENILSFSVDEYHSRLTFFSAEASSVDIGLVENVYTGANEAKRRELWRIREVLVRDLQEKFPGLVPSTKEKYSLIMDQFMARVPGLRFLFRHNLI